MANNRKGAEKVKGEEKVKPLIVFLFFTLAVAVVLMTVAIVKANMEAEVNYSKGVDAGMKVYRAAMMERISKARGQCGHVFQICDYSGCEELTVACEETYQP